MLAEKIMDSGRHNRQRLVNYISVVYVLLVEELETRVVTVPLVKLVDYHQWLHTG